MTGTDIEPMAAARAEPPPTEVDRSLALAASRGDDGAFASIYERHHAAIHRYCASMLGEHDAADALQGTMTKALVALRGGEAPRDLRPWLYRIAHNESIDMIRERRSRSALGDAVEQQSGSAAALAPSSAERSEERQRLQRLIADIRSLPGRQRSAIVMRELSGLSTTDIAAALETSESTAKQAVYEARVALTEIQEGREMPCEPVQRAISDGDGRVLRGRRVRAHMRGCERCQAFAAAIEDRSQTLHSYAPVLPALVAGGILQQILGAAGASGGASAAAAGTGAAATGAGVAGAGGAAALSGGVAKLAAIAAATLAIGAGGYEGLKVAGVVDGGGADRAADAGPGGPSDSGAAAPSSEEADGSDGVDSASASATEEGSLSGGASSSPAVGAGGSEVQRSGGNDARDGGGAQGQAGSNDAGSAAEQTEDLPEAASGGQEQAESRRPEHAGRPDAPGSRAGSNSRGAERSAGGRERAQQSGRGSSNRGGNSGNANRGGNSGNANRGEKSGNANRGGSTGTTGSNGGGQGSGGGSGGGPGGSTADRPGSGKPGRVDQPGGERPVIREPRGNRERAAGGTSGAPRQERGERPS